MFLLLLCSCLLFITPPSFAALTKSKSTELKSHEKHDYAQFIDKQTHLLTLAWQASQSPDHQKDAINLYEQFVATYPNDPRAFYARFDLAHLSTTSASAKRINEILLPILTLKSSAGFHPHWLAHQQLYACNLIAQHYKREKKEIQTLRCFLNMLGIALNNEMHMQNNKNFPLHSPVTVKELTTLLRNADYRADVQQWLGESDFDTNDQQKFLEHLYTYADQYESSDGTFLLAQHILETHATLNKSILTKLVTLINKLQIKTDKIILLKQIFAKTSGNDKMQAAYHLGMLEEDAIRAGIYQNIAASHATSLEPQQIYRLSKTIKDEKKQNTLLIAAAKEGHPKARKEALEKNESTGQDTKAYFVASDWAKTMDPDGIFKMATYKHAGFAGAYSPTQASKLYKLAAEGYRLQGKFDSAQEAALLSEITNYQRRDFFAQRLGNDKKIIKDFHTIKQRLNELIKMKSISAHMKQEVKIALAIQFINVGEYYSDKNKQAQCFNNALLLLKDLPADKPCGNYNHATLLFEKYLAPKLTQLAQTPYDKIDQKIKVCAEKVRTLYKGVYESLKDKQPHNTFVMKTYLNYGALLKQVFKNHITAKEAFEAGTKAGSAACMLYLSSYIMKEVKTLNDFDKPIKLLSQALIQAQKDNNAILIKEAAQRLNEIKMLRKQLTPDSMFSDAYSSPAIILKAK